MSFRRRRKHDEPMLSIVIPVFDAAELLPACLDSVLGQDHRNLDVVLVDDGSADRSLAVCHAYAARDRRITVLSQANAGPSAARNTGIARATGQFLTFVDADDTVTLAGIAEAVQTLAESGSDIAVMPYQRLDGDKIRKPAAWIRELHASKVVGTTLEATPSVMVNAIACAKIFRRDFWDRAGLRFLPGVIYEDQILTAEAYREATAIDILSTQAYNWRLQESSVSQGQTTVDAVLARLTSAEKSLEQLEPLPAVRSERALQLLRFNMPNSVLKLERADDAYLDVLLEKLPALLEIAPADRYAADVPAQYRVLYDLIRRGERDRIWDYVRAEGMQVEMHPSGAEDVGFVAYLPGWGSAPVPAAAYVLTAHQTCLKAKILGGRRVGRGEAKIDLQAWFQNVGLDATLTATVTAGGTPLEVEVTRNDEDAIVSSRQGAERRYDGSGWTLAVRHTGGLPKTLDVEIALVAGDFSGSKRWRSFATKRLTARP